MKAFLFLVLYSLANYIACENFFENFEEYYDMGASTEDFTYVRKTYSGTWYRADKPYDTFQF